MDDRPPPPRHAQGYNYNPTHAPFWVIPAEPAKGLSIAALVCGIVGSVAGLIPLLFVVSMALGLVAIVLGFIAWAQRGRVGAKRTTAAWGIGLGTLALCLGILGVVIVNNAFDDLDRDLDRIESDFGD